MAIEERDIRVLISFPRAPKTKRLIARLGPGAIYNLISLWCFVAEFHPKGILKNVSARDVAEMANVPPMQAEEFVSVLVEYRWLDRVKNGFRVHNWKKRNGWIYGFPERQKKSRNANKAKYDKKMGELPKGKSGKSPNGNRGTPPSPSPSPLPLPSPSTQALPKRTIEESVKLFASGRDLFRQGFKIDLLYSDFYRLWGGNGKHEGFESLSRMDAGIKAVKKRYGAEEIKKPVAVLTDFLAEPGRYMSDADYDNWKGLR